MSLLPECLEPQALLEEDDSENENEKEKEDPWELPPGVLSDRERARAAAVWILLRCEEYTDPVDDWMITMRDKLDLCTE